MTKQDLLVKAGLQLRDPSNSIYTKELLYSAFNGAIDRFKQVIPELTGMVYLDSPSDSPILLPDHYHQLIWMYAVARAFEMDERAFDAGRAMNEFESKLNELKESIADGSVVILNESGEEVITTYKVDYIVDVQFGKSNSTNNSYPWNYAGDDSLVIM